MPFTVEDFHDLRALLEAHPEWRQELRSLVLTDELLALPEHIAMLRVQSAAQFQALAEAQQRTESQLTALTEQVAALATSQQHTDAQLVALTMAQQHTDAQLVALTMAQQHTDAQLVALTMAQQHTDAQLVALTMAQQRTDAQLSALTAQVATLTDHVGELKGYALENWYQTRGAGSFHRIVRRPHILTANELTTLIEDARDSGILSEAEANDLFDVDVVVRGRQPTMGTATYLAVEVSWGVGLYDVERAVRRAALLARIDGAAVPVVAGKWINHDATQMAQDSRVWQLIEGRVIPPTSETTSGGDTGPVS